MTEERLKLGQWGEQQAADYLNKKGFKVLRRNYRCRAGEIDIICRDKKYLIFAEVKTRRSTKYGLPQEAVGVRKQRQIVRAAQWYIQQHDLGKLQPRFDVLAVLWQSWNDAGQIDHIADAFSVDI